MVSRIGFSGIILSLLFFSACVSTQTETVKTGSNPGTFIASGIDSVMNKIANIYMDRQEEALCKIIAYSDNFILRKKDQTLIVVLKGNSFFDSGKTFLKPGLRPKLDEIVKVLNKYSKTSLIVECHTDSGGDKNYNQKISELRAETVKIFLVEKGVDSKRIIAIGYGEEKPFYSDDLLNRRIEIRIIPIQKE